MQDFTEVLMTSSIIRNKTEERRAAFRAANASLALEGLMGDSRQLARQEEVIQGRLTTEQAIALSVMEYRNHVAASDGGYMVSANAH